MSSTNKTTNLKLNKWIGTDRSAREDFNNDNDLIDKFAGEVTASLKDLRNEVTQISQPNLLINGDFKIWQRGTSFTTSGRYTADRWGFYTDGAGSVNKTDDGVTITQTKAGVYCNFSQFIEGDSLKSLLGKPLTLTFKLSKATNNVSQLWAMAKGTSHYYWILDARAITSDTFTCSFVLNTIPTALEVGIQVKSTAGASITLKWAKLEVGSVATPFVPRSYGEELALCQRYFVPMTWSNQNWHHGFGNNTWLFIPLPNQMRTVPTLYGGASVATNWYLCSNGVEVIPTGVTVRALAGNGILLQFTGKFTINQSVIGYYNTDTLGGFDSEIY